jgi:parallel beta-helix repeat protein
MDPEENAGPAQRNVIRDSEEGIVVAASAVSVILNNHILENTNGIRIVNSRLINVWANTIENNDNYGVDLSGGTGANFIGCNWIGVAADGLTAAPNDYGIYITEDAANTFVFSNTLSGNTLDGMRIVSSGGNHLILSNTIGLDPTGVYSLSNGQHGIGIVDDAGGNRIGSPFTSNSGNLISSNTNFGLYISNSPTTTLEFNYIGVAKDGVTPRGNGLDGVYVLNSDDTQFGTLNFPGKQIIANSGENGINLENAERTQIVTSTYVLDNQSHGIYLFQTIGSYVTPQRVSGNGSAGIRVQGNSAVDNFLLPQQIYENGGLPIELGADGLEPNDPGDTDPGPNGQLNYPEVTSTNGSVVTGTATVGVYAVAVYEVLGDPTQPGGGGIFRDLTFADASGNWSVDLEPLGLAYKPVAFSAHSGGPGLFNITFSPLSPVTQLGYSLYLPVVQRD